MRIALVPAGDCSRLCKHSELTKKEKIKKGGRRGGGVGGGLEEETCHARTPANAPSEI